MTDTDHSTAEHAGADDEEHEPPKGSLLLLSLFLLLCASMWIWMYVIMLERA